MVFIAFLFIAQTTDQVKATFNRALIDSDGAKLHSVLSAKELNGASAKACSSFLALVTKPRIKSVGTYGDTARTKFQSILDPKSPMTIQFRPTGGADIYIDDKRAYAFEPAMLSGSNKVSTGFADIAFWAAHWEAKSHAKGTLDRALYSHKLVESWVPKFKTFGIKGGIDSESKKYMDWAQIIKTSAAQIDRLKKKLD